MSKEFMTTQYDVDPTRVVVEINTDPIKTAGGERPSIELLQEQADVVRECIVPVDYTKTRGTCIDERKRIGLLNGEAIVEPRPSVPAGPNVFMLATLELTGYFPDDETTGTERLAIASQKLKAGGLRSGGHLKCAGNAQLNTWMGTISKEREAVAQYARHGLGAAYDAEAMDEVFDNATDLVTSGRYADWHEGILVDVLGEEAGEAIEELAPVDHEGIKLARNKIPGTTIDQTKLYEKSVVGKGDFDMDDDYADTIEHIATSGPDAAWKKKVAEHAREAILAALAQTVPNEEIYEDIIHE